MSHLQFTQVSLDALAVVSDNGKHITRQLIFGDGHHKLLGCIIGDNTPIELASDNISSTRFEITQGEVMVSINDAAPHYYRANQAFLVNANAKVLLTSSTVVQYVRHLEG